MVKVVNVIERDGKEGPFILLELQGELELVQSQRTGNWYATIRKCIVPCTLDLSTAKFFIGKEIPGKIVRTQCEPYEYTMPETGELVQLAYRWSYEPEEKVVKSSKPTMVSQTAV
jgi:hypothetical protein